jgi:DNA-binding beta-propeller fold protein YncE
MTSRYVGFSALLISTIAAACAIARAAEGLPFKVVADIPLTGNATRLDYQSLDPSRNVLFISHLGDSAVVVVDLRGPKVIATIPEVSNVHGVLAVPQRGVVYATATGTNEVVVIDEHTLKIVARAPAGVYPDGMAYDHRSGRLFVSDEHGRTETVIDTHTNKRIATIDLGGDVGNTQYDPTSRRIFVNVQTTGQLVEIDPIHNTIVRRISLAATGCIGNHGLLIDARHNRAFIACTESETLLQLDLRTGHASQIGTTGEDPDVLALDPTPWRLFVAAESGVVSIFTDRHGITKTAQAFLAPAAHTVAVDPRTNLVYFPLENVEGVPRLRVVEVTK